jgi:histidinol-phosphatase (PHP family)
MDLTVRSDETCGIMVQMLPADNHVHSEWSWDTPTGTSMMDTCRRAVEIGLPAIAFTEHVDFTAWGEGDNPPVSGAARVLPDIVWRERILPLDVVGYQASLERCRDQFPELKIRSGIEAGSRPCWPRAPSSGCWARCTRSCTRAG